MSKVIYKETQDVFFKDVTSHSVVSKMMQESSNVGLHPHPSEVTSWENNAKNIKLLLIDSNISNCYVTFEYRVPYYKKRIDCMLYGKGVDNKDYVVHIELKQWSNNSVSATSCGGNFDVNGDEDYTVDAYTGGAVRTVAHPSQQVRGYHDYLKNFVESIITHQLELRGYAYCYNYNNEPGAALYDNIYDKILKEHRTFSGNETAEFAQVLHDALAKGDGFSIFNKMMQSPIRPSRKLLNEVGTMVAQGNTDAFSLLEDQIVARNVILDKIRKSQKSVILVQGGPGTGKTVIALRILAELAKSETHFNAHYATKSASLLSGIKEQLPRGSRAKYLFSNITSFNPHDFCENELDVLLVDEAQGMEKSTNNQYTPAAKRTDLSMIDCLIRAAKVSVFFIDDLQGIRSAEIGSSSMIKEAAERLGVGFESVELKSQFRCNGSDNYLDWLEDVLYNKTVTHFFSKEEFDFQIFDDPKTLYETIVSKDAKPNGDTLTSARLTAGFCWPWSDKLDSEGNLVKDVRIGNFAIPWETHRLLPAKQIPKGYCQWFQWAFKPEGIKQCGCIYTAQGFEFDYVGVIIGPDLKMDPQTGKLVTDRSETKDPTLSRGNADAYIRNIYRVLMSRGMKGCYVYFCDKEVEAYFKKNIKEQ